MVERDIALILTDYFCTKDEDKKRLFYAQIATAHSLQSRVEILVKIVKKDYPRYWEKHVEILKKTYDIIRFRNKLAHSVVDVSEQALARPIEEGIGFIEWNEGEPTTDVEFQEWDVACAMVSSCLNDIKLLLPFREVSLLGGL